MKTQYYVASSLDGFIATQEDSLDWLFPLGSIEQSSYPAFIEQVGALAMGASTYQWMLNHGEKVEKETGSPWPYTQPTWVFTHRQLPQIKHANVHFVQGDVTAVYSAMQKAAANKNMWIVGGGELAGQFYDAGLLDELIIQIGSTTLGSGKPLLPRQILHPQLTLHSINPMGEGMVELRYHVQKNLAPSA